MSSSYKQKMVLDSNPGPEILLHFSIVCLQKLRHVAVASLQLNITQNV